MLSHFSQSRSEQVKYRVEYHRNDKTLIPVGQIAKQEACKSRVNSLDQIHVIHAE